MIFFNWKTISFHPSEFVRDLSLIKRWNNLKKDFTDPFSYRKQFHKGFNIDFDDSNVFAIQLYGIDEGLDGRRIFDLVAASFASYPDKDYCVFSVQTSEMKHSEILNYFSVIIWKSGWKWWMVRCDSWNFTWRRDEIFIP